MNWRKRTKSFLSTQIDLSARIDLNGSIEAAIATITTKYFCTICAKQIPAYRFNDHDALCKFCERAHTAYSNRVGFFFHFV